MPETIGFIGLGAMGGGMAANLVKAGFEVVGMDLNPDRNAALAAKGGTIAKSPADVARGPRRAARWPPGPAPRSSRPCSNWAVRTPT
jgi:6-phosphogluconate dehydrogenase (decarboxylating)